MSHAAMYYFAIPVALAIFLALILPILTSKRRKKP